MTKLSIALLIVAALTACTRQEQDAFNVFLQSLHGFAASGAVYNAPAAYDSGPALAPTYDFGSDSPTCGSYFCR